MGFQSAILALNLAAGALAHGYIKFIGVDNKLYAPLASVSVYIWVISSY
jgi:hypothetical protein